MGLKSFYCFDLIKPLFPNKKYGNSDSLYNHHTHTNKKILTQLSRKISDPEQEKKT